MTLKVRNGQVYNEDGIIIAVLTNEGKTEEVERVIEMGSEAVPVVEDFVEKVNSGSFKPRAAVKEFETHYRKSIKN